MANQTILLIDPDTRNLSVMEVQLRKYGYVVHSTSSANQAMEIIRVGTPDLIISEMHLNDVKGLDFCRQLKNDSRTSSTPFIFLSHQEELKMGALEIGADDFLTKPVYMGELKDRIEFLLQKKQRLGLEKGQGNRFFGRLEEMGLLDLLQIVDVSRKSGQLNIEHRGQKGSLWFKEGEVLDAEMAHLNGLDAICRLLTWEFGQYEFDFNAPSRPARIKQSMSVIKAEGMKRLDQWNQMCEQLPPLETIFRVERTALDERGEPLTPAMVGLMNLFNGQRTMQEVIDQSAFSDLEVLQNLTLLYFEGLIYEVRERAQLDDSPEPVFIEPSMQDTGVAPPIPQTGSFPAMNTMEANLFSEPPPISESSSEPPPLPEEGQELLADFYASISEGEGEGEEDAPPPPIPKEAPNEGATNDDYSTLFGSDDAYKFDPEEQDFFSGFDGEDDDYDDYETPEKKPLSGSAKVFFGLLFLSLAGVIFLIMQDRVTPIELSETVENKANWHYFKLNDRNQSYILPPLQADWKIEKVSSITTIGSTDEKDGSNQKVEGKLPTKQRKVNSKEKRRISKLLQEAKLLHDQGGDDKYERAARLVEEALGLQPLNLYALLLSAKVHMELGQDKIAIRRLQMIMKQNPNYGNTKIDPQYQAGTIYVLMGSTLQTLKRPERAIKVYEDYLRLFPEGNHVSDVHKLLNNLRRNLR